MSENAQPYPCPICRELTDGAICAVCWERRQSHSSLRAELEACLDRESRLLEILANVGIAVDAIRYGLDLYIEDSTGIDSHELLLDISKALGSLEDV